MRSLVVQPPSPLKGEFSLSGDKAIAHRALLISALANGPVKLKNFPANQDCLSTLNALKKLAVEIHVKKSLISVYGKGLWGLVKPKGPIFVGDSGTTLRLLLGILAGQDFSVKLSAGKSLSRRPMLRVTKPLRRMFAQIKARRMRLSCPLGRHKAQPEEYPPLSIQGGTLRGITYKMPLASAQVKSAILLAGLYPDGKTKVIEPIKTRDHTERMLRLFKAEIKVKENTVVIKGGRPLVSPGSIYLPGDISSASFFVVAASLVPGSRVLIKNVSLNPTRAGSIRVLKRMGADIKIRSTKSKMHNYEPSGDIIIKAHPLRGTVIRRREIPSLIDELPILMVAASLARGTSIFNGIGELRVKETDRIKSMSENLKKMGAQIKLSRVGNTERIILQGASRLRGAKVRSFGDHRTALSMVVAGLAAQGQTVIDDISCIAKSFPDFLVILDKLLKRPLKNYSLHR